MPHIIVKMYAGRTKEQKQALADELAKTLITVLGSKPESISIGIEDVVPAEWDAKVRQPDIVAKPETIFKTAG